MKRSIKALLFSCAILLLSSFVNTEQQYFVQFKVNAELTKSEAMLIDQKMRLNSGINVSRTDFINDTYFCLLREGINYSQTDFVGWFSELGYSISCFNKGIHNQNKVISSRILKDCGND